jgi:beta-glucosidase/6-phospho-beta-glucosidase/beta-galactosidase
MTLQVKYWITINDPYKISVGLPGVDMRDVDPYIVGQNLIKAHARVYNLYKKEFKESQKG